MTDSRFDIFQLFIVNSRLHRQAVQGGAGPGHGHGLRRGEDPRPDEDHGAGAAGHQCDHPGQDPRHPALHPQQAGAVKCSAVQYSAVQCSTKQGISDENLGKLVQHAQIPQEKVGLVRSMARLGVTIVNDVSRYYILR